MIRVAIAEDDFRIADIHESFLKEIKGVKVVGKALNANETIKLLGEKKVDLLLLDIYMPDMTGVDLLPIIRDEFPEIDIIMITAATEKPLLEASIRGGVFDYLIKPVSIERFTDAIKTYKNKKELLSSEQEVNQTLVDNLLGIKKETKRTSGNLPKGIDPISLQKVKTILEEMKQGMNAEEMGEKMGASRTTARRYLEYLTSEGIVKAEVEYGIVGRPERKYYLS